VKTALLTLLMLLLSGTGCASKQAVDIHPVAQSHSCMGTDNKPRIRIIDDPSTWKAVFTNTFASMRPDVPAVVPAIDFSINRIVILDLGEKPNTGYALRLEDQKAVLKDDVLHIRVKTSHPAEGMMYAQMITRPCLAVQVPKGDYHTISVTDQHGIVLAKASCKPDSRNGMKHKDAKAQGIK
jgi:hypothetical protein